MIKTISDALEKVKKLRGVTYNWIDSDESSKKNKIGFATGQDSDKEVVKDELYSKVQPEDLLKFGLIPESMGITKR